MAQLAALRHPLLCAGRATGRAGDRHVPELSDEQAREHGEVGVTMEEITEPGHGPPRGSDDHFIIITTTTSQKLG
jgi:hypothetical protein